MTTPTIEVVINEKYGGFGVSDEAKDMFFDLHKKRGNSTLEKPKDVMDLYIYEPERTDPVFVEVVKTLGPKANGPSARLKIVKIPEKFKDCYVINEYDGLESLRIDYQRYKLQKIKSLVEDPNSVLDRKTLKDIIDGRERDEYFD